MSFNNDYLLNTRIENVASKVFYKKLDENKKDIFSLLKYYVKYDPELTSFRNLSIEHYNKIMDSKTTIEIEKASGKITRLIDRKIYEIEKTKPVDIIVASAVKHVEPDIQNNRFIATSGLILGICNLAGLVYLARR